MKTIIPNGWKEKTLSDLCHIEIGKTPSRSNALYWDKQKNTSNVWLSIADLNNIIDKNVYDSKEYLSNLGADIVKVVKKGTLLLSFKLTLGRVAFAGKDLRTNEAIAQLPIKNAKFDIDKYYLYYYLKFFDYESLLKGDVKVKGKTLNKEKLKLLPVFFPSLPEQQRIVAKLDKAFEAIDRAKTIAENNLKNAKELFESTLNEVFTKNSDDWEEKKLGEICDKAFNRKISKDENEKFIYIDITSIDNKQNRIIKPKECNGANAPSRARQIVKKDDVIFSTVRTYLKNIAYVDELYDNQIASTGFCVIRTNKAKMIGKFIFYKTLTKSFLEPLSILQTGANYPAIRDDDLFDQIVKYPSVLEQQKIVEQLDKLQEQTKQLEAVYERKSKECDELKQAILHQAFRGDL